MQTIPENKSCNVCRQPTDRKCTSCKLVYYCTIEHQKNDWNLHKNECQAYEIAQSPELGRYLRTTRDLEPGDTVFGEEPIVYGPKRCLYRDGTFPCIGCCRLITKEKCEQCPVCTWPVCNGQCLGLKSLTSHGLECELLKLKASEIAQSEFWENLHFDVLLILRVLLIQRVYKEKWELLMKLDDHLDKRGPGTDYYKEAEEKLKHLQENFLTPSSKIEASSDLIHKICGILDAHTLESSRDSISVEVLYPTACFIEHNCIPNVSLNFDKNYRITIRTSLPLQKLEHFTTAHVNMFWGTQLRRQFLQKTKFLSCRCDRCNDPTELGTFLSALKCMGSEMEPCGGTQLPVKPCDEKIKWICNKCKIKLPNKEIMKFVNHLGSEVEKVLSKPGDVGDLEEVLGKLLNFLHSNHYHVFIVKYTMIERLDTEKDASEEALKEKIGMCLDLIDVIKKIDPGNAKLSWNLATIYNKLFQIKFILLTRSYSEENQAIFLKDIEGIKEILDENRRVLFYESKSVKLYEMFVESEREFGNWLKANQMC